MIIESPIFSGPTKGFIVFEGLNGAGKSTLLKGVSKHLGAKGISPVVTREPGATPLGKAIRALVVEGEVDDPSPMAELFLFCADRAEHVRKIIKPSLSGGKVVLCDRYHYSTLAFQGYGRGMKQEAIRAVTELATQKLEPDLVVLLDLPHEIGLARVRDTTGREAEVDVLESEGEEFHRKVREGFLKVASESPTPFLVVDASVTPEEVLDRVLPFVDGVVAGRSQ